jgi:hypothetical protein
MAITTQDLLEQHGADRGEHSMEVLPLSTLSDHTKNVIYDKRGVGWIPVFCANCGCDCGLIVAHTFAFMQCDPCSEKFPCPEGFYRIPDEVFFAKMHAAIEDHYKRELSVWELLEEAKKGDSIVAKLINERIFL